MLKTVQTAWRLLRQLSGDDAYERYLEYHAAHQEHGCAQGSAPPLTKRAFFKQWQDEKWQGIKRCC